ncbi:Ubiquitin carboxyl-terminal hydrolase 5 [Babesia sp. Xinjiang]|uniref:Ubiquitin carboxyl-terminal hydrolase 5 n=1 Tax=Babesia sp. Xinjiang TaxID=462227 RepID=UPI000A238594|nr:Ubiquitin carboxyl-terminal hydrolase 5 [Babesia sp. Xinjiang]ORM39760.1 Ubiquitin carboxyl-terminal hydrolase 5 [Babesia sp. Xinjiang]
MQNTDTEKSPDGMYINLKTYESFGKDALKFDRNAKDAIYLHVQRELMPVKPDNKSDSETTSIGTDRGTNDENVDNENSDTAEQVVYKQRKLHEEVIRYEVYSPSIDIRIPLENAPKNIADAAKAIIDHAGFNFNADEFVWKEYISESKYAKHLIQVEHAPVIVYDNLSCARCGANHNLWLNLSDGYIGCGRKNYDSGGCADGEEGAAIQHYHETGGIYPLAVKIGTITATSGDVYSYAADEDSLVIDPYLADHLAHFGIDVRAVIKTEKTIVQLELEKNENHDWSEMNTGLSQRTHGPGLVGLHNLGNTCYLNSAVQLLASVPELASYFVEHHDSIAHKVPDNTKPCEDVPLQFAKIVKAISTDKMVQQQTELIKRYQQSCQDIGVEYVEPEEFKSFAVKPSMLKYAIGRDNSRFATGEQQDAEEFFSHMVNLLADLSPEMKRRAKTSFKIKNLFFFRYRQYIVCETLSKITYNDNEMHILCLPLLTYAQSQGEIDPHQQINLMDCIRNWEGEQEIDYLDRGEHHVGVITNALLTLPTYLALKVDRFFYNPDGTSTKINNPVIVPQEGIILETQGDKEHMGYTVECNTREPKKAKRHISQDFLQSLMSMGFSEKICRMAVENEGSSNIDACVNWILSNMDTISEDTTTGDKDSASVAVNAAVLMDLGYTLEQANMAAERFADDVAAAVDWLAEEDTAIRADTKDSARYELLGVISHIGQKINAGHYVCHIKKNGNWYTFNDAKVLKCETPPTGNGYLYLFRRSTSTAAAA